jgi:hypothetical protein
MIALPVQPVKENPMRMGGSSVALLMLRLVIEQRRPSHVEQSSATLRASDSTHRHVIGGCS